jgi:hypothetical protein
MKSPIRILQDYLKEIVDSENKCRLNNNTDDLKEVTEIKSQFIFAISELDKRFKIKKNYEAKYVDDKTYKSHQDKLKLQTQKPYYKGRAKKLKPKKDIVLKNGQRIARLNFLNI